VQQRAAGGFVEDDQSLVVRVHTIHRGGNRQTGPESKGPTLGGMTDAVADALAEHVRENRRYWDAMAVDWVVAGERAWADSDASWFSGVRVP